MLVRHFPGVPNSAQSTATKKSFQDIEVQGGGSSPSASLSKAATFPEKLMAILTNEGAYGHIISWMPEGDSFVIRKPHRFTEEILPEFFHHGCKFNSFTRKLYFWGFKKLKMTKSNAGGNDGAGVIYYHKMFNRDSMPSCMHLRSLERAKKRTAAKGRQFKPKGRGNMRQPVKPVDTPEKNTRGQLPTPSTHISEGNISVDVSSTSTDEDALVKRALLTYTNNSNDIASQKNIYSGNASVANNHTKATPHDNYFSIVDSHPPALADRIQQHIALQLLLKSRYAICPLVQADLAQRGLV